jgi:hypothetical protein
MAERLCQLSTVLKLLSCSPSPRLLRLAELWAVGLRQVEERGLPREVLEVRLEPEAHAVEGVAVEALAHRLVGLGPQDPLAVRGLRVQSLALDVVRDAARDRVVGEGVVLRADLLQRHRQEDDDVDEAADEEEAAGAPAHELARVRGVHVVAHGLEGPRAALAVFLGHRLGL